MSLDKNNKAYDSLGMSDSMKSRIYDKCMNSNEEGKESIAYTDNEGGSGRGNVNMKKKIDNHEIERANASGKFDNLIKIAVGSAAVIASVAMVGLWTAGNLSSGNGGTPQVGKAAVQATDHTTVEQTVGESEKDFDQIDETNQKETEKNVKNEAINEDNGEVEISEGNANQKVVNEDVDPAKNYEEMLEQNKELNKKLKKKYLEAVKNLKENDVKPTGGKVHLVDSSARRNKYAIADVNGDAKYDLVLSCQDTDSSDAQFGGIYYYDFEKDKFVDEGVPNINADTTKFYNSSVMVDWKENPKGRSEKVKPFDYYCFSDSKMKYEKIQIWDVWEKDVVSSGFPANADRDGDGVVYFSSENLDEIDYSNPIDNDEFDNNFIKESPEQLRDITFENIFK